MTVTKVSDFQTSSSTAKPIAGLWAGLKSKALQIISRHVKSGAEAHICNSKAIDNYCCRTWQHSFGPANCPTEAKDDEMDDVQNTDDEVEVLQQEVALKLCINVYWN